MMPNSPLARPPRSALPFPCSPKGCLWAQGWQEIAAKPQLSRVFFLVFFFLAWQLFTRNSVSSGKKKISRIIKSWDTALACHQAFLGHLSVLPLLMFQQPSP